MKNKRCALVAAVVVTVCTVAFWSWNQQSEETVAQSSVPPSTLEIRQGSSVVASGVSASQALILSSNQTATVRGTKPYILTSERGFDKPLRLVAESLGVRTVGVLSANELLVEADAAACARLAASAQFSSVSECSPSSKISPGLAAQIAAGAKDVNVAVVTLSPADHQAVQSRVIARGGEILKGCFNEGGTFRARLDASLVSELASCGDVRWMEVFVRPHLMNDLAVNPSAMNVRSVWLSDARVDGLSGAGQIISTSDSGIDTGDLGTLHPDLTNQVCGIQIAEGAKIRDENGHGTHTAGSIAGDGTMSNGRIRGTAWGAKLYAWFCGGDGSSILTPMTKAELFQPDQENFPAYIHSASWGSDKKGEYDADCVDIDEFVWSHPDFLPVFSAGNDGRNGSGTIGSPAAAKNVLAVGATQNLRTDHDGGWGNGDPMQMAVFSSRGPCQDKRIKPDVAAPGVGILSTRALGVDYSYGTYNDYYAYDSGTSMACPLTAGAMALVREWLLRQDDFSDDEAEKRPTAALMKAIVMGGAKDAATPNTDRGWGRVDLAETLFPSNRAVKLVDRIPFAAGEQFMWLVETTNEAPFDVQLAWVDYPGAVDGRQIDPKLVNDLDLTVQPLYGDEVHYGNGGKAADDRNNAESVRLESATTNRYLVTVSCKRVLYDCADGGAAALYIRGAFDPDAIEAGHASVRVGSRGFASLDYAVAAARAQAPQQTTPVLVEVLEPTELLSTQTIDFDCVITSTNADPYASVVTRRGAAALNVATNGCLALRNLAFDGSFERLVDVASNGVVSVSGLVDFGVSHMVAAVRTASTNGFELAGALACGIRLDCTVAKDEGASFGFCSSTTIPAFEGITNTADRISNANDPAGEMRGYVIGGPVDYRLVWRSGRIPLDEAVGYFVDKDGGTNTTASIDKLVLDYLQAGAEGRLDGSARRIVIRRSGTLSQPMAVGEDLTLVGEDGAVVTVEGTAGFTLTNGTLTIDGVDFRDYKGSGLFVVDGLNAELVVTNSAFRRIVGTDNRSGAIAILKGRALVGETIFEGCSADVNQRLLQNDTSAANGGAIYLQGVDCELHLCGGSITNCRAFGPGGGVYVGNGALLGVSGDLLVKGNYDESAGWNDNIHIKGKNASLVLDGALVDREDSIGVRYGTLHRPGYGNAPEQKFVDLSAAAAGAVAQATAIRAMFNDCEPEMNRMASADGSSTLSWTMAAVSRKVKSGRVRLSGCSDDANGEYALLADAIEAIDRNGALVELLGDVSFADNLLTECDVSISATGGVTRTVMRIGDVSIVVKGSNSLASVTFDGGKGTVRLFDVNGGALTLGRDATVRNVNGSCDRASGGVVVQNGGTFTMKDGSAILGCTNSFVDVGSKAGYCGGLLLDHSKAYLHGGTISGCAGNGAGGVFAGNVSEVYVSGSFTNVDNRALSGELANMKVADRDSHLYLDGPFTGASGYIEGAQGDVRKFGEILFQGSGSTYAESAHRFTHDLTGDIGLAVVSDGRTLLVWGAAVASNGKFVDRDGTEYQVVTDADYRLGAGVPEHFDFTYDGEKKTGVPEGIGYVTSGTTSSSTAGTYRVWARLRPGFAWDDGTYDDRVIIWSIAKATYDMSGVLFVDAAFPYDGLIHELTVSGTLPEGVTVSYADNALREIGSLNATATFAGDFGNYETIDPMMATLTIFDSGLVDPPKPPEADPFTVDTNAPTPIAFSAITRRSDTEWELVVTDLVERAEYALSYAPELLAPSKTGEWFAATSSGPTNLVFTLDETKPAYFWRAHGRTTYVTNYISQIK